MNPAIATQNLTRYYGRTAAVDGLNLTVPEGSIYAFLGQRGDDFLRGVGIDLQLLAEAAHGGKIVTGPDGPGDHRLFHRINHLLVSGRPSLELYAER